MNYKKLNNYVGLLVFLAATTVYFLTAEETASLWDCGEFIATAYKLEVGHPPGAPLFMLLGRVFSLFAGSEMDVGLWVNRLSALSSSFSILFLFWTITLLGKKVALRDKTEMTAGEKIVILGSGVVGAMAYTFTESFWFSAVEGEVYAMASLFTAIIFWAALKWDEEMTQIKRGELSSEVHPLRWMVLIMFLIGLAIGVHLLGLLVLPAIAYVVAYQYNEKNSLKIFILTGLIGFVVLAFIQNGVIPGSIAIASKMEIFVRNSLGLPFGTGAALFFILLTIFLVVGLFYTKKKNFNIANTAILGFVMLLIGYGSFATIIIRSDANPPLDENNPENLVTLHAYLKREQYGTWPLSYGEYFNSKPAPRKDFGDRSETYDRRWVVLTPNGNAVTSFKLKSDADEYVKESGQNYKLEEKYFVVNEGIRKNVVPVYSQNTIFPRMFDNQDPRKVSGYKSWSGYDPNRKVSPNLIGADGRPLPSFGENLTYFVNYQMGWMYWRYFMWNFAGRQNDIQGHGDEMRGNWLSGYKWVDEARLGAQGDNSPYFTQNNPSHYKFFYIPIILGLIGIFFQVMRAPKDAIVVGMLFLLTGLAIIIYLNQKPFEPRERDYAYAASFYAFAIWIGLGVYGLYEAFKSFAKEEFKSLLIVIGGLLLLGIIADIGSKNGMPATISIVIIGVLGGGALALMSALRKINFSSTRAAGLSVALGLLAPIIMGFQNWEGHDRSNRTSTRDLAHNYLVDCSPNAILFTNGDNDTFPLWFVQEVEGYRTDVRVANLSLMQTDWYSNQMKMRAYESDPLPIKFREDQILMGGGNTDYVLFVDYEIYKNRISAEKAREIIEKKIEGNQSTYNQALGGIRDGLARAIDVMRGKNAAAQEILDRMKEELEQDIENPGYDDYDRINKFIDRIANDIKKGNIDTSSDLLEQLEIALNSWTQSWDYLPLDYAMEFVRDDANMLNQPQGGKLRYFPASGFVIPVNVDNAISAEIISESYRDEALKDIRFNFRKGGYFRSDINGLSREEVMMLDILANFDWKRGIFFSSPGGSDVAKALYTQGLLANNGQTHSLVPLGRNAMEDYSEEKMYENIVQKYHYGNLAGEGVLVDYYTRRHTDQFRTSFIELANKYYTKYRVAESDNKKQEYADKIEEVLVHSLEKLPIKKVFDFGEPRGLTQKLPNGEEISTDGTIPEYIRVLYEIGKIETAENLAFEYLKQLETMMNYFQYSDALIAYENKQDFIAFAMNFMRTYAQILVSNPDGQAAVMAQDLDNRLANEVVVNVVEGLKDKKVKEVMRGGKTNTRTMDKEANEFYELYEALLEENGFGYEE